MGVYYPGNGTAVPYDEPGKPDRTNEVARLNSEAAKLRESARVNQSIGYTGHAAGCHSDANRLEAQAKSLERRR